MLRISGGWLQPSDSPRHVTCSSRRASSTPARRRAWDSVQRVADDALEAAIVLAEEIAMFAPLSIAGHKRALNLLSGATRPSVEDEQAIDSLELAAFSSRDLEEGLAAFGEKRTPRFEGR